MTTMKIHSREENIFPVYGLLASIHSPAYGVTTHSETHSTGVNLLRFTINGETEHIILRLQTTFRTIDN